MARKAKPAAPAQSYHFFGSHAFDWVRDVSREAVLERLAKLAGADYIKRNVHAHGGLYAWTCRVEEPLGTSYAIENYAPVGVPISAAREYDLLTTRSWAERVPKSVPLDQCTVNKSWTTVES